VCHNYLDKRYQYGINRFMHVDIVPNRNSRPCALIRETFRENGKPRHRTIKNISDLPMDRIIAIKRALQGDFDGIAFTGADGVKTEQGSTFGALYAAYQVAKETGLGEVLGTDRRGKLALLMVLAQVISPMSRRALVEWAKNQALWEVLGLCQSGEIDFDEDDLYAVLDEIAEKRHWIELELFKVRNKACSRLFLYDVTSSYLEGTCNELSAWGFNRDGKKGKKQIVIGLLTDKDGDPVAVDVFKGNTSDPKTVVEQIKKLSERFGVRDVVFVGDRGMLKRLPLDAVQAAHFSYITAITKPQVEALVREGVIQLSWLDECLGEVEHEKVRYVFRRNPVRAMELEESRLARMRRVEDLARDLSLYLAASGRRRADVALRKVTQKIAGLKVEGFVSARLDGREVVVEVNQEALGEKARLDGVYVLKTDTPPDEMDKEWVHKAYKSLYEVERDFRSMKTELEVRPVYLRNAGRTRGHVLVVMLALILKRELQKRLAGIEMEVRHALGALAGWSLLNESLGELRFTRLPQPNPRQQRILDALGIQQPTVLGVPRKRGRRKKQ
jgi:transposase